jgi:CSLREA domain-containing protein
VIPLSISPSGVQAERGRRVSPSPRGRLAIVLAMSVLGLLALAPAQAAATTFAVTKTADTDDGTCNADCSLREAVKAAEQAQAAICAGIVCTSAASETVVVPAGIYREPLGALAFEFSELPGSTATLSVVGAGAGRTIIDAQSAHRAVDVSFSTVVTLRGMTIRNGRFGGNDDPLCTVPHTHGGGVHNHGVLAMEEVTLTGNSAPDDGGGLASGTCASFANAPSACPIGRGSCATLVNVTITGNHAPGRGGGIFSGQALSLTNVTIANNSAGEGSGIYAAPPPPPSTNPECSAGACARSMTLVNTIVSARGSAAAACAGPAPLTSLGHNVYTDGSCHAIASDLVRPDPLLSGLQADGTLALLPGSPAIDAGTNSQCPPTDERGVSRPQHGACDIGAYEVSARGDDEDDGDDENDDHHDHHDHHHRSGEDHRGAH